LSSLKPVEKKLFEEMLGMSSGYVLDFTNATFAEFFRDIVEKNIYSEEYSFNGDSKAKRIRAFWEIEPDELVGKVLLEMIELWKYSNPPGVNANNDARYERCKIIISRLFGEELVEKKTQEQSAPKAFVSYSWDSDDHKKWVAELASRLRADGVETILDQWHAVPGDQLPEFMEREIRENDYVLIICTPAYRLKSDARKGGVGYEGDIMTAEVYSMGNHRKYIPILASGTWKKSAPLWLSGKYHIDMSPSANQEQQYQDLLNTIHGTHPKPPPVKTYNKGSKGEGESGSLPRIESGDPIKILGVIVDEVKEPLLDGTRGSALYKIPFRLSRKPSNIWTKSFLQTWERPPQITSMHRPDIASILSDKIVLDGTTVEEVKKYHRDTLILCVNVANEEEKKIVEQQRRQDELARQRNKEHREKITKLSEDLEFD